MKLFNSPCLDELEFIASNSVDAIVTDPPYGLGTEPDALEMLRDWMMEGHHDVKSKRGFMGKEWDAFVPQPATWRECLRVLKPGGHLLSFAGTRTQDLVALGLRIAGFEIRDLIAWVYGSGFPKSHNGEWGGTALKPALEPITFARKPLIGTVAENMMTYGTGGLNIDGCRVGSDILTTHSRGKNEAFPKRPGETSVIESGRKQDQRAGIDFTERVGRWPANLIHDGSEEVMTAFPQAPGQQGPVSSTAPSEKTGRVYGRMKREGEASAESENTGLVGFKMKPGMRRLDEGSAARFFYCAKASKADRGEGNTHPTVKPLNLMRYLCRLVTPVGGTVLDPYMGSGTTGKACLLEGFDFIGIEKDADYFKIAQARLLEDDEL